MLKSTFYLKQCTVQIQSQNCPLLYIIVLLFNTFPSACLLDLQKKIRPARLFHPARLLIFRKISTLHTHLFHPALLFDT